MAQNNGVIDEHWRVGGGCYVAFWHEQLTDVCWPGDLTAQAFFSPSGLDVTSFNLHNHLSNHHTPPGVQTLTNHILIFCGGWSHSLSVATFHHDSQVAVILLKDSLGIFLAYLCAIFVRIIWKFLRQISDIKDCSRNT